MIEKQELVKLMRGIYWHGRGMGNEDVAHKTSDYFTAQALANCKKVEPNVIACGVCLYSECEEKLPPGTRWCGKECRDEWQNETKKRR